MTTSITKAVDLSAPRGKRLVVRPHPGQLAVISSSAFCTAAIAGTGGGKTTVGMLKLALCMAERPGLPWIVAEPIEAMVDRILLTRRPKTMTLPEFFKGFDPTSVHIRSRGVIRTHLGDIFLTGAENPDSWQGGQMGGVWLDEPGLMRRSAFTTAVQRVGYYGGKILLTTTPYNMGWLYTDVYLRAKDGDPDYRVVTFPSIANPTYPREEVERARRIMDPALFAMRYLGQFGRPEGMIYSHFSTERNVVEDFTIPADWPQWGGLDYGYNHPTAGVWFARGPDGMTYWHREYRRREATVAEHAKALRKAGGRSFVWYADSASPQMSRELRLLGLTVTDADKAVQAGIDVVHTLLAEGRLKIFASCKESLDELAGYVYKKDRRTDQWTDEPVKERDDLLDAGRYGLYSESRRARLALHV